MKGSGLEIKGSTDLLTTGSTVTGLLTTTGSIDLTTTVSTFLTGSGSTILTGSLILTGSSGSSPQPSSSKRLLELTTLTAAEGVEPCCFTGSETRIDTGAETRTDIGSGSGSPHASSSISRVTLLTRS